MYLATGAWDITVQGYHIPIILHYVAISLLHPILYPYHIPHHDTPLYLYIPILSHIMTLTNPTPLYPIISLYPYYIPYYIPIKSHTIILHYISVSLLYPILLYPTPLSARPYESCQNI